MDGNLKTENEAFILAASGEFWEYLEIYEFCDMQQNFLYTESIG